MGFLDQYRYYLKVERGMSPNTVAAYVRDVKDFFTVTGLDAPAVSSGDIVDYLAARDMSKRSQARLLSSLRSFFAWLILEKERDDNP